LFKAVTKDISILRNSLDSVSSLVTEGTFKINSNGIGLIAMDPASVAMVIYNLLATSFDTFEVKEEGTISFNISQFVSILKRASTNDIVTIESDGTRLKITMEGATKRTFTLPLMDIRNNEQKIPELKFNSEVEFDAKILKDSIKDVSMVSDCVQFVTGEEGLIVSGTSEGSEVKTKITNAKISGVASSKYSVDYLDKMMGASKIADKLKISFSDDYPLRLDYKALDKLQMSFILAPRVDTD